MCSGSTGYQVGLLASPTGPPGVAAAYGQNLASISISSNARTPVDDKDIAKLQVPFPLAP
jgi:hypothetical protein